MTYSIDELPELFDHLADGLKSSPRWQTVSAGRIALNFFRKASMLRGQAEYIWPEEVKPGDRRIIFEPTTVKYLASQAEKALISLSFHRSAKALLVKVSFYIWGPLLLVMADIRLFSTLLHPLKARNLLKACF